VRVSGTSGGGGATYAGAGVDLAAAAASVDRLRALAASHVEEAGRTQSAADRLSSLDVPVIELPRLYQAGMDRAGVEILGRALLSGLAGGT